MRQLSYREIASFCEELSWLVHSGVNVSDGLALLAEEEQESEWKNCLKHMSEQSDEGRIFSEIVKEEQCFPTYVEGILNVGETTGRLEESLKALARYYTERDRMNRRVKNALLYPSILLLLMLIVLGVLLTQVLPIFESVFVSLGGELNGVAGGLLHVGLWLNKGMPILCVILVLLVILVLAFALSTNFREQLLKSWRIYAGDKGIMRKMNDAAFAQAIAMGLSSGLPMEETLELAGQVLSDIPAARERCLKCKEELEQGAPLIEALRTADVFPAGACRLLSLGMQSGNGDAVMADLAERLSEEADTALSNTVAKVEPTLVLVTSVLVGVILLSVMLPLMNIMETIG